MKYFGILTLVLCFTAVYAGILKHTDSPLVLEGDQATKLVASTDQFYLPTDGDLKLHGTVLQGSVVEEISTLLLSFDQNLRAAAQEFFRRARNIRNSDQFRQLKSTMNDLVQHINTLSEEISRTLEGHQVTMDTFSNELSVVLARVIEELNQEFPSPDTAPTHAERSVMVSRMLDKIDASFSVNLCDQHGIDKALLSDYLRVVKAHLEALVVTAGDLAEQHPKLLDVLVFSVISTLIPEGWFLQPLLRVIGFGVKGPIKGTLAAWMQKRFFGAVIPAGSWFSYIQSVAMGVEDYLLRFVVGAGVGAVVGNLAGACKYVVNAIGKLVHWL
ncbi:hypothetical protein BS17DRAFT_779884 [Gyrodon lividus]|nr:hypothetical protein BS17DRAFT_779884 [Gyrodon lividus]